MYWPGPLDVSRGLNEQHRIVFQDADVHPPGQKLVLKADKTQCLHINGECRRLAERGYDSLVIGAVSHLDVTGRCWHVGDVLAEEDGRPKFTLSHSTPHVTMSRRG